MTGLRRFFSRWPNVLGFGLVLFFILVALAAPLLAPAVVQPEGGDYAGAYVRKVENQKSTTPQPPSPSAWLGTTVNRMDVYYWLVWGARPTLAFSLKVSLITALLGVIIGTFSGYRGGRLGRFCMRITDGFLSFPVIACYLILAQLKLLAVERLPDMGYILSTDGVRVLSPEALRILSFDALLWSLILLSWMPYARMLYAVVSVQRTAQYVQASEALGAGPLRILFRHLIPNSISPAIVLLARDIGAVVILQASLAFAGFGSPSPWGNLLLVGRNWMIGPGGNTLHYWWVWLPATLVLVLFGIGWNLLGDGLNEALNPKTVWRVSSSARR